VAAIVQLRQAKRFQVEPLSHAMAYSHIMSCCPVVNVSEKQGDALDEILRHVLSCIPVFQLECRRDDSFESIYSRIRDWL